MRASGIVLVGAVGPLGHDFFEMELGDKSRTRSNARSNYGSFLVTQRVSPFERDHPVSNGSRSFPSATARRCLKSASPREVSPIDDDSVHGLCSVNEGQKGATAGDGYAHGTLWPKTAIDVHSGVSVQLLVCRSCSRRWYSGDRPRLAIAA